MVNKNSKQEKEGTTFMSDQFLLGTAEYAYDHPDYSSDTNQISQSTLDGDREVFAPTRNITHSLHPHVNRKSASRKCVIVLYGLTLTQ